MNSDHNEIFKVKWGIGETIVVLVLSFLITALIQIALTYTIALPYVHSPGNLIHENFIKISTKDWYIVGLIMIIDSLFFIFFPIFWIKIKKHGGISTLGLNFKRWAKPFMKGAIYGLVFAGIFAIPSLLSRLNIPKQDIYEPTRFDIYIYWFLFLKMVFLAPVSEEILFTGFIFPPFATKFGNILGALITSVIFLLFHPQYGNQIFSFFILFAMKIIAIWLFVKRKTLIASIGFHMTYNILAYIGYSLRW